jgi:hypothetical protein
MISNYKEKNSFILMMPDCNNIKRAFEDGFALEHSFIKGVVL